MYYTYVNIVQKNTEKKQRDLMHSNQDLQKIL